jgi:hypothetical protein
VTDFKGGAMTYTRLDALRILANAYWYVARMHGYRDGILFDKFNHVRRALNMEDLKPCEEGYNPRGPGAWF